MFEAGLPRRLHEAAGGNPRVLNHLCRLVLRHAAEHGEGLATVAGLDAARTLLPENGTAASAVYLGQ